MKLGNESRKNGNFQMALKEKNVSRLLRKLEK